MCGEREEEEEEEEECKRGGRRRAWCGMEQHVITSVAVSLVFFSRRCCSLGGSEKSCAQG